MGGGEETAWKEGCYDKDEEQNREVWNVENTAKVVGVEKGGGGGV